MQPPASGRRDVFDGDLSVLYALKLGFVDGKQASDLTQIILTRTNELPKVERQSHQFAGSLTVPPRIRTGSVRKDTSG